MESVFFESNQPLLLSLLPIGDEEKGTYLNGEGGSRKIASKWNNPDSGRPINETPPLSSAI
jgi:hypothetical protein